MKMLNKIDMFIVGLTLISALIIQSFIFFEHDTEWYRSFYYILGSLCVGFLLCIGYCLIAILKSKRYLIICVLLPCVGMVISIQQYKSAITHIDPSEIIGNMNYFTFVPFVFCSLVSLSIFAYTYFRKSTNHTRK